MNTYRDSLNNLYNSIVKNIQELPDDSNSIFDDFILDLYNYTRNANGIINEYEATNKGINIGYLETVDKYKSQYLYLKEKLDSQMKEIENTAKENISSIKEKYELNEAESLNTVKSIKLEQTSIMKETNTQIYNHLVKKNQKNHALEVYKAKLIEKYNYRLDLITNSSQSKKDSLYANNNKSLFRYNKANDAVVETMNTRIQGIQNKINECNASLAREKEILNIKVKEIDTNFNTFVNTKTKDVNSLSEINKQQYKIDKQNYIEEIKAINQKYNIEKSKVLKDFISDLEKINASITSTNDLYKNIIEETNRFHLFKMHDLEAKRNDVLQSLRQPGINKNDLKDLRSNLAIIDKQIREENKQFKVNTLKYETSHFSNISNFQKQKNNLEKRKDAKNEIIDINESIEVEKIKNQLDILELEYGNMKYNSIQNLNKEINNIRQVYDEQKLSHTNDYKLIEYKIEKEISKLMLSLDFLKMEINFANKIESLVEEKENLATKSNINTTTITSILGVEKNNYLKTYNFASIDNLVKQNNCIYSYEEQNLILQREKKNDFFKAQLERNSFSNEHIKKSSALEIEHELLLERKKKILTSLEHNASNALLKNNLSYLKYSDDEVIIKENFIIADKLIKLVDDIIKKFISFINSKILISNFSDSMLYNLINKVLSLITDYKKEVLKKSLNNFERILNDLIAFNTDEKYEILTKSLDDSLNSIIAKYTNRNNNLNETMVNYNKTIKSFYQNIVLLENKKILLEKKLVKDNTDSASIKKDLILCNVRIKENYNKIMKNETLISMLKKDLKKNDLLIAHHKQKYAMDKERLNNNKIAESHVYYKSMKNNNLIINNAISAYDASITNLYLPISDIKQFKKRNILFEQHCADIHNRFSTSINNLVLKLSKDVEHEYEKSFKNIKKTTLINKKDILHDFKKSENEQYFKINTQNNKYSSLLKNNAFLIEKIKKKYSNLVNENKALFDENNRKLLLAKKNDYNTFYTLSTANQDNVSETLKKNIKDLKDLEIKYKQDFKAIVKKYEKEKKNKTLNFNLKEEKINDFIKYLPKDHQNKITKSRLIVSDEEMRISQEMALKEQEKETTISTIRKNYDSFVAYSNKRIHRLNDFIKKAQ